MNDIDILVTAPLPPFLYDPLKSDYRCHDYVRAGDKDALLRGCRRARRADWCRAAER